MSAVRGGSPQPNVTDPRGPWCVSQGWHESYAGGPPYDYPPGPNDALDEVSQWGSPGWPSNCHSNFGDPVDLAYNGTTTTGSGCTTSAPCPSLLVKGITGKVYPNGCHATEADLYDYATYDVVTGTGDWKGKQRMLHVSAPAGTWTSVTYVAWATPYFDFLNVGTTYDDRLTGCPITG